MAVAVRSGGVSSPLKRPRRARSRPLMTPALERVYASFDHPESALDPIQIVRRYDNVADREVVAFVAAGLAFGRVASVMASVEAVCGVLGSSPAAFVRGFEPARDGAPFIPIVHRWIRGQDLVGLIWILRHLLQRYGSLEQAFVAELRDEHADVGVALEAFAAEARTVNLRPAYGHRVPAVPGVYYFFSTPASGGACKRLNLFLRWMVRRDGINPGGWTRVRPGQLVVPLDTHTIRVGKCLRFTTRVSPGWKMAADITAALREVDQVDPVRFDFALCHLSMMGACGWQSAQGSRQCPLRDVCRPARPPARTVSTSPKQRNPL